MKIGELAKQSNCSVETIRYYEKTGLLPSAVRADNNYRFYTQEHADRLHFIRNCRALDLSHEEIRHLLAILSSGKGNCVAVQQILAEHIEHVRHRMRQLQQLERQLIQLDSYCQKRCQQEHPNEVCNILQGLSELNLEAPSPLHTHNKRNLCHD